MILKQFVLAFAVFYSGFSNAQVPVANFSLYPNPACLGSNVVITDLSNNSPTSWSYTLASASPSLINTQNPITTYNTAGVYTIALVSSNGSGSSIPVVKTITITPPPISPAITGSCQSICASTATLNANPPSIGTGTWTLFSGTGSVVAPNQPTTGVVSLSTGTNIFLWSIINPGCISSATTCVIRSPFPTPANAGPSQTICVSSGSTSLNGNTPIVGVGTWSVISGSGTVTSPNSPTSTVTGLTIGTTILQWNISTGCNSTSSSTVAIYASLCTGINRSLMQDTEFNVSPNPSSGEFMVRINKFNGNTILEVHNSLGQLITKEPVKDFTIKLNLSELANGVYHIRISSDGKQLHRVKLIKN